MGSTLKWNLFISLIHISYTLKWHDIDIGKDKCQMREMDPLEKLYYILLWRSPETKSRHVKIDLYYENHTLYENESCIYKNCLFTHSTHLMNLKKFDAILFNGRNLNYMTKKHFPGRGPNQIYGFVQLESAQNFPLRSPLLDDLFNITISYKLDSDIPTPYFNVHYLNGPRVSFKNKVNWKVSNKSGLDSQLKKKIYRKSKLAAWFVSRCDAISKRDDYVRKLNEALKDLGFKQKVDIFGDCGKLICLKLNHTRCLNMLSNYYMFYLAFENSFSEDYYTEKILSAVQHDTVPIVYGGADYNRLLPQGSYLDACKLSPKYLAGLMISLYHNRQTYENFFKWRQFYSFRRTKLDFAGPLCDILNEENHKYKRHKDFREWWNRKNIFKCSDEIF